MKTTKKMWMTMTMMKMKNNQICALVRGLDCSSLTTDLMLNELDEENLLKHQLKTADDSEAAGDCRNCCFAIVVVVVVVEEETLKTKNECLLNR